MIGSDLLDAAIGVIFVILTFSLLASALQEALAGLLNLRGRLLRRAVFRLLSGAYRSDSVDLPWLTSARIARAELAVDVLCDPSIRVLHGPRSLIARLWDKLVGWRRTDAERLLAGLGRLPAAIPPGSFADALIESLLRRMDLSAVRAEDGLSSANIQATGEAFRELVASLSAEADRALAVAGGVLETLPLKTAARAQLRRALRDLSVAREVHARLEALDGRAARLEVHADRLLAAAETRIKAEAAMLADWFDVSMQGLSDWYARRTRVALFTLGVIMAMLANVDLPALAGKVVSDAELRGQFVERAEARIERPLEAATTEGDAIDAAADAIGSARDQIAALPGHAGVGLGRHCAAGEGWFACIWRTASLGALISWLLIGLGCMMGGQFWYDALGAVVRLRPARTGHRPA